MFVQLTHVTGKKVKMPKKTKSCLLAFSVNVWKILIIHRKNKKKKRKTKVSDNIGVSKSCAWIWANPKKKKGEWKAKLKSWTGHSVTLADFVKNCLNIFSYSFLQIWINLLENCQNSTIKDCEKNKSLYKYQMTFPHIKPRKIKIS